MIKSNTMQAKGLTVIQLHSRSHCSMPHTVLDVGQINRSLAPAPKEGAPSLAGQTGLCGTHYNAT